MLEVEKDPFDMSSGHTYSGLESDQALLCWSETPSSPSREEFVQVLESHLSVAVIKSALKVSERTKVTLIGKDYTGIGIVRSCETDGKNFIMTIAIGGPEAQASATSMPDPSVLLIDDFLTEEQETQILEDLGKSMHRRFALPRLRAMLRCRLMPSW